MSADSIVIGLDGGGTYTRVLCAKMSGQILTRIQTGGAAPKKNADAEHNVQSAIIQAITDSGYTAQQVAGLVAGFAEFDSSRETVWAERFTAIPGFKIVPHCVNDAVVAHAGAFCLQPGIVAIAGTGSIIFGVTETGRHISNYDFRHHTGTTARDLGYDIVFRILAGDTTGIDAGLVERVLTHFEVADIPALAEKAASNSQQEHRELMRQYGNIAPLVTEAAGESVPLARAVCDTAVRGLELGIRLVGSVFESDTIPFTLIGGVARSQYIQEHLAKRLERKINKRYKMVEPALAPEAGAVLMALDRLEIVLDETIIDNLRQ